MKFKSTVIILFFIALWSASCTPYKNVPYFQNLKTDSLITERISNYTLPTIQQGDLLAIHANSLNKDQDNLINYNLDRANGSSAVGADRPGENAVIGYTVDQQGDIKLPFLGKVKAAGLTADQLSEYLETNLATYLSKVVINVRIQNMRISVLGDVRNPGVFNYSNDRTTVTEALAMAGDLNTTGVRNNVLLIREENGERKYIRIDLRSKNIITSPAYYIRSNDVIYVQPNKEKVYTSDTTLQKVSVLISALSILAIFITRK